MAVFLLTENMRRLQTKFLSLRPGTRIVSNTFGIPEWPADARITRPDCTAWCTALLWIVPAQVGGDWQIEGGPRLRLDQHFQKVSGLLTGPVGSSTIQGGTITGPEVTFTIGDAAYARDSRAIAWSARAPMRADRPGSHAVAVEKDGTTAQNSTG